MTRPGPAGSITSDEGMRWYVFGEGEHEERFLSVTTALGLVDKEGLRRWATSLSANAALDELPRLVRATRTRDCGNTWKRCGHDDPRMRCATCPCGDCGPCVRKWIANRHYYESRRRAEEGSRVHAVAEHWALHSEVRAHEQDITAYVEQWQRWLADYALTPESWEMSEATVINREYGYAGTLDGIVVFHADASEACAELAAKVLGVPLSQTAGRSVRLVVDFKTREKEQAQLYPEYALQQAAYRNAQVVRLPDGREEPMPATDGAVIVQVRQEGYLCQPVVTDDQTFGAFLSELAFARWYFEHATRSVSPLAFKVPKEPPAPKQPTAAASPMTPAKRAPAAKKTAATKAAKAQPDPAPALPLREVAKQQSATLASMRRAEGDRYTSLPDDGIPF